MAFNAPIKRNEGVKPLRGTEKVAALLLAMGRELSSGVLKEFDPDEIKIVTRAAADLKPISTPELEAIIEEFAQNFSTGPNIFGTVGELEKLLTGVLPPDQVSDIISAGSALPRIRHDPRSVRQPGVSVHFVLVRIRRCPVSSGSQRSVGRRERKWHGHCIGSARPL